MPLDEEALYRILGSHIRAARDRTGLSQARLAKGLGMSRTSIVNIEAGRQHPPLHVIWAIAEALGTDVALLLPSRDDLDQELGPVELDTRTIAEIEAAANGDPRTKRDLVNFISRAKTKAKAKPK